MSLTRPLTRSLTRALSNSELTQKLGGGFSIFALNPYLLFDARDSMIGTLENPTLDLNPALPETLDVITATRAGTATFTDANGLIASAPANTVRVDYVDSVPMILVEPSSENLVPYSEDISNAAWTKFGGGTGVAPTVTPDFGTSPDGTVSASRVQFNKGSGTGYTNMSVVYDSASTSSGATTAKSVYLKSNTTEAYEMVIYEVTDASGTNVKKITVTPDWQRFDVYGAISSTTTGIAIGLREINVSGLSNTADVLVWGAQVETGSVATSLIPTSGGDAAARTRAADQLSLSTSVTSSFFSSTGGGTFYAEFVPRDVLSEQWYLLAGQDYNRRFMYSNASNAQLRAFDGTNTSTYGSNMVANQLNRAAFTYTATTQEASIDGSTVAAFSHNGNYLTTSRLYLASPVNDRQMNGHLKRLIYWPYSSENL